MTTSSAAPQDVLLSSVGKPLRLHVPYKSFDPPAYGAASETVVGRLWTYDAGVDLVVLETGAAPDLPTALHRAPAAIVYNSPYGRVNSTTSGFKLIRGTQIAGVEFLTEEEYHVHTNYVSELCTIPPVSLAAMEVRDAASVQKSLERILRIGPKAAGEVGQTVFDALSKTLPCRWQGAHIIVLDEVVVSGPDYDVSSTYVPNMSREQIDRILEHGDVSTGEHLNVDGAQYKANTWMRVTKVLGGVREKHFPT